MRSVLARCFVEVVEQADMEMEANLTNLISLRGITVASFFLFVAVCFGVAALAYLEITELLSEEEGGLCDKEVSLECHMSSVRSIHLCVSSFRRPLDDASISAAF